MNLFSTTSLLLVSAAVLFCLTSSSSAAAASDAPSSQHEVHILHRRRRLNSKTSKALLFSKTSKAYDSTTAQFLSDTPASATQDTPDTSSNNITDQPTTIIILISINVSSCSAKGVRCLRVQRLLSRIIIPQTNHHPRSILHFLILLLPFPCHMI